MTRRVFVALIVAALAWLEGCSAPKVAAPVTGGRPRLVVLFVVDGLPERQVAQYHDQLAPDGFERFFARGIWFTDAHYGYAVTETGPGHSTLLTGAYPDRTGIVANDWYDAATGKIEYCADSGSPRNLLAESLGDVLKRMDPRSKVIAVAGKDRAAILPAGREGTAYWYQPRTGHFISSSHYMREPPQWVAEFNARKPADHYFHAEWKPMLAEAAYSRSLPDGLPWYGPGGKLPRTMGDGKSQPDAAYYGEIEGTPFFDDLVLAFARAAIEGEALGRDEAPDILVIGLSAHDYVNHAYSAESRISHDHFLYLDRELQDFFGDLDAAVGRDNYVAVLTADHGFMPAPEYSRSLGRDAGRIHDGQVLSRLNAALTRRFGGAPWVVNMTEFGFSINATLAAEKGVPPADVAEEARKVVSAERGIAVAYTRAEMEGGSRAGAPSFDAMRRSWNPSRSPDVQFALRPYWMFSRGTTMTTHGSPYDYDTHVPLLFYGPAWIHPWRADSRVEMRDLAPTLARLLRVPAPSASEGRALDLGEVR